METTYQNIIIGHIYTCIWLMFFKLRCVYDLKQPLGMTSILVLLPHWSSVSHGSCFYFFQNFHIFTDIFNQHFYETRRKPKQTICIPEGRLNVFTVLGHMLMASAQRWVDNQCCRCVLPCPDYETPIFPQLAATALILPSDTWEYVMESA